MGIVLGPNQYGKAEVRLVSVTRDGDTHSIKDLTVSTSLRGDLVDTHLTGDNTKVLATDTQKNTAYAFAKLYGVHQVEDFALRLARHFVAGQAAITGARVLVDEHLWQRIETNGHSFTRSGGEIRTAAVTVDHDRAWVVSGLKDLVVLKTTGSEFHGFPRDEFTTLAETDDRVLATSVTARWRHSSDEVVDWAASYAEVRRVLLSTFADKHSLSLQQTLYAMAEAVLLARPEVAEVRLSMPNKHHVPVDLSPFGLDNRNEVFHAPQSPYGLIEGSALREEAEDAGLAWYSIGEF
ncbi:urate oxidase [Actinosynnema pretiosum subsp. pretiosum]|uniref:Uricase n=2 Tax=Actinosynnema TaxID=40566 RepID=C6WEX2_ACTMD|nr:urate oxidase [Actinosynnema mirum]ACU39747.1 urate oxidase [Actinosynnema mirum DSM 43827]AXX33257.1 Uricase (urate oxidase) [Actinosynnema pretiosum subsp. pretiosum]QUF02915.1 urate oxidase [Actinosynnema pretiosum subsp. pretiosum]